MVRKTGNDTFTIGDEEFNELFEKFQILLSLEHLSRNFPFNFSKFKIFDLDAYDEDIKITVKDSDVESLIELGEYIKLLHRHFN